MPNSKYAKEHIYMSIIPEEKRITKMNEIEKRKIVEHNDLISSVAKMDKTPLKIFELAVSCIDTDNPPQDNIIYLSKTELFKFFDVSDSNKHSRFKKSIEVMQKQAFFEVKQAKDKGFKYESIVPIPYVSWTDYNDEVEILFNPFIMPYLIDLKNNFTQYALSDSMELNRKYSIILYKWLSMNYNQYEHYSNKGGRRKEQLEEYFNPSIKVVELRKITDTVDDYKLMHQFTEWVLEKPLKEINEHTHFNVTYEKIKKGRSIECIQFHISKKVKQQELNGEYKVREQDPAYLQGKEKRIEQEKILSATAMQSPYTMELITSTLLSPVEMTDITLMANLQQEVYPLYKELEDIVGLQGVRKHLEYVANKKLDYSKPNLVKYLKTAVMRYLDSGDTKQTEKDKTKFIKSKGKVTPVGNKTPEWYEPDYKNETTEEQLIEMEKIKQEHLNKFKS